MGKVSSYFVLCFVRLSSVFVIQTYFVPDEYWQSLEVAHRLVYGYGYLTWEWQKGIRSYVYPGLFALLFKILQYFDIDYTVCLIYGPRVLQALITSIADVYFCKWSNSWKWSILICSTLWFSFYTASRTIINTFESNIITIGLSLFPWQYNGDSTKFLWSAALVTYVRPTSIVVWLPLCLYHLYISSKSAISLIFTAYIPIGFIVYGACIALDFWFYQKLVITPLEFVKFNLYENIGAWYGALPWHWYLSHGLFAILGITLLPFFFAIRTVVTNRKYHQNEMVMLGTILFALFVYSLAPHKEYRFLLPILPLILYLTVRYLCIWSRKANEYAIWLVVIVIIAANAGPAWYFGQVHQRGTLDVMQTLRTIAETNPHNTRFLFLMPCHSTPLYSHIHVNVSLRFLTCEPNFNNTSNYTDEADQFYSDPKKWWRNEYPLEDGNARLLPTHIILYDVLQSHIQDILSRYKMVNQTHHTKLVLSDRIGKRILIYQKI